MVNPNILTTETEPPCPKDSAVLHFLKELPGVVWVLFMLIFFTAVYINFRDDFIPRIIDALIGAFLSLVVQQRTRPHTPPISADTIGPVDVNVNQEKKEGE